MSPKHTTIGLHPETKDKLDRYRVDEGESYDKIVNRLLEESLPRSWPTLEELEKMREEGEYIPLEEVIERLGL
ncbi:hypothetical protein AKJ49_00625 [candidate division MSBL1 archaeon SCGC-AAA382A03]|uniref:Uncharacterized protein n=1 Tax=candidate division MSBL1 archaeon SCGC-AAA382A03 TaxID=1698278 RepID=A0A133VGF0_9EURY|nr:hypothetical protein AKJ49_00625 [candidate division MSBL1 archaeon SCGC-AAA382A03]